MLGNVCDLSGRLLGNHHIYLSLTSNDPNSIVSNIQIFRDDFESNISVRAKGTGKETFLRLKAIIGTHPYYSVESMFSIEPAWAIRLKSKNHRLIKHFINKILLSSPSLDEIDSMLINNGIDISKDYYHQESEIPAWDILDESTELNSMSEYSTLLFNSSSPQSKVRSIYLHFKLATNDLKGVGVNVRSVEYANELYEELCLNYKECAPTFRIDQDCSFFFKAYTPTASGISIHRQAIACLIQFEKTITPELLSNIARLISPQSMNMSTMERSLMLSQYSSSSSRTITLCDQIEAVKGSPAPLKKLLDTIADSLLNRNPPSPHSQNEIDQACQYIASLKHRDSEFYKLFFDMYAAHYENKDDVKYILEKRRFLHHFLFSDSTNDEKSCHIRILQNLIDELRVLGLTKIPVIMEFTQNMVDHLRGQLLIENELGDKAAHLTYLALMILSKHWPIDKEDYITCDVIAPQARVFIRTGHQYDLPVLMKYHNDRNTRPGETRDNKKLLAPNHNEPFDTQNKEHIMSVFTKGFYTRNDAHPLESLYAMQFIKNKANQINRLIY